MTFKKFQNDDLIYSTLVAKPDVSFIIHQKRVYLNYEIEENGDFSNKIKHIRQGELSLYEINVNRPTTSLAYQFIEKDTTRYASKTVSAASFDDTSQFGYGDQLTETYPLTASISRIFVDAGQEFDLNTYSTSFTNAASFSKNNKKYIRALKNVINGQDSLTNSGFTYSDLGTKKVNIICVPAIFYGSTMVKNSIELNYYVTGTLTAQAKDVNGNGVLIQTFGTNISASVGLALYNQGLLLLTGSWSQHVDTDNFFAGGNTNPSWLSFGTGIKVVGNAIGSGSCDNSSYEVKFKGTNKIPTLTMKAYARQNEFNYSHNPTFLDSTATGSLDTGSVDDPYFSEGESKIKNIKNSGFAGFDDDFENITYISKIGIYDKHKNLIAIATLANPVKKTEYNDYMFKLRLDF